MDSADPDGSEPDGDDGSDSSDEVHDSEILMAFAKKIIGAAEEQIHEYKCVREVYGVQDPEPEPEPAQVGRMTKTAKAALHPYDRCMPI